MKSISLSRKNLIYAKIFNLMYECIIFNRVLMAISSTRILIGINERFDIIVS